MKKIFTVIVVLTLAIPFLSFAQVDGKYNYQFVKAFPDTGFRGNLGGHGIAVDPAGKVWWIPYGTKDSIMTGAGTYGKVRMLYCWLPNGTAASFGHLKTITVGGVTDTLWNSGRGMTMDEKGNPVVTFFDKYYKVNYKTGAGLAAVIAIPNVTGVQAGVDDLGEMVTGNVIPGSGPLKLYDNNFNFLLNVTDTSWGYSRAVGISANGNDVYWAPFDKIFVQRFHCDNGSLGPYDKIDTVMVGLCTEAFARHPKTGYIWVGTGNPTSGNNVAPYTNYTYYGFKPTNLNTPVESFTWHGDVSLEPRARGIAFSPTGDTVYVTGFNDDSQCPIQMFKGTFTPGSVKDEGVVATGYELSQNYPNPFNPTTEIKFSIVKSGYTTLKVYDILGNEVSTLANGNLDAGVYRATFDGNGMASGAYFYILTSGDTRIANKMVLMK